MPEPRSKRSKAEDTSRVDYLLGRLVDLLQRDPSPALRNRLSELASQRLNESLEYNPQLRGAKRRPLTWLRPVFAAVLLIAIASSAVFFVRLRGKELRRASNAFKISPAAPPSAGRVRTAAPTRLAKTSVLKTHRSRPEPAQRTRPQQLTVRLPYSNSAIENGTDATIRVAISRSELLSLGFPVSTTVQDGRVVAELTLGDDGLPRAISLPLPLEVIKEKR